MGVSFIPSEFFGLSGAGQSLQRIGAQRREDEESRHQRRREGLADTIAQENAAILRFQAMMQIGKDNPGDQGLAIRQQAMQGLRGAGLVPTDSRLKLSPEDINANADALALATPLDTRTDEQHQRVGNYIGLDPGVTAEDARIAVANRLRQQGFELGTLEKDADVAQEYRTFLEARGTSPGQIEAELSISGLADLRAGTSLRDSQALEADAQARLAEARADVLGEAEGTAASTARLSLLQPFFDNMAKHGVDVRVASKLANGNELTFEEEKSVTQALTASARAASTISERAQLLADLLQIKELGESTHALALAGIASEIFGPDVVTATSKKTLTGKIKWELDVNVPLAISRLNAPEGGDPAESQQSIEDAIARMQQEINGISTMDELSAAISDIEQQTTEQVTLKPIIMQMLQERARELEGGREAAVDGEVEEGAEDLSKLSEEELIKLEQELRGDLTKATDTRDVAEITRIRQKLLEIERLRLSGGVFGTETLTPSTGGIPVPASRQRARR